MGIARDAGARWPDGADGGRASAHFDVEINVGALAELAVERRRPRPAVDEYLLTDGRRLCLLAEGRLVNLAAAEGHPSAVMDMSFANQLLAVVHLARAGEGMEHRVYPVPDAIDREVARRKLDAMAIVIDDLSAEQRAYPDSWEEGT